VGIHGGGKREKEAFFLTGPKTVEEVHTPIAPS
jgi:hypothetical protein